MAKIIKYFYRKEREKIHDQGTGISVSIDVVYIFGIRFVSDVHFNVEMEWIRSLKRRIAEDEKQQNLEKHR